MFFNKVSVVMIVFFVLLFSFSSVLAEEKIIWGKDQCLYYQNGEISIKLGISYKPHAETSAEITHQDGYIFVTDSYGDEGACFNSFYAIKDNRLFFKLNIASDQNFSLYCWKEFSNFLKKNNIVIEETNLVGDSRSFTSAVYQPKDQIIKYQADFRRENQNTPDFYYQIVWVKYDLITGKKILSKITNGRTTIENIDDFVNFINTKLNITN